MTYCPMAILIVGPSTSGKSYMSRVLLQCLAHRHPKVWYFTNGARTKAHDFLPEGYVVPGVDFKRPGSSAYLLQEIIDEQARIFSLPQRERDGVDWRVCLVFDDFTHTGLLSSNRKTSDLGKLITYILTSGGTDYGISIIMQAHNLMAVNTDVRDAMKVGIFLSPYGRVIKQAETDYNFLDNPREFRNVMQQATGYTAVVVDKSRIRHGPWSMYYKYDASLDEETPPPGFECIRLGCPELWQGDPRLHRNDHGKKQAYPYPASYRIPTTRGTSTRKPRALAAHAERREWRLPRGTSCALAAASSSGTAE